jgi:hypothetical protein
MQKSQKQTHTFEALEGQQKDKKLNLMYQERFNMIEERLLVGSVPCYFFVIILVMIASAFAAVPWMVLSIHMLISLLSVSIAFVLLIKWVAVLRSMYIRAVADRGNEETVAMALGAGCVCVMLTGLIVLVAVHASELSVPSLILLFVLPIMLIWQYRHIIFGAHEK